MPKYLLLKHYRGGPERTVRRPRWTSGRPRTSRRTWPFLQRRRARCSRRRGEFVDAQALTPVADLGPLRRPRRRTRRSPTVRIPRRATSSPAGT